MRWRPIRVIAASSSLIGAFYALDHIEKTRATGTPSGWNQVAGVPLPRSTEGHEVGTSAWRVGPQTRWEAEDSADQMYTRPVLGGPLGLSLAANSETGTWIWFAQDKPSWSTRAGEEVACMGSVSAPSSPEPLALVAQENSLLVTWGDQRMVCPAPLLEDRKNGGRPSIQTLEGSARLISIGRDKRADGVPVSPLWWMSGLMVGGLLGMLLLDLLLSAIARIRPAHVHGEE